MRRSLALIATCVLLLAAVAGAQTDSTIVAGQSLGGIRLQANVNDAVAAWGSLVDKEETRSGKFVFYDWPLRPVFAIAEKESGRIVMLGVLLSDAYRTDKGGITGGSERQAVEAAYGQEFEPSDSPSRLRLIYNSQGIAFDIGRSGIMGGRVVQIIVFGPGQWKQITEAL